MKYLVVIEVSQKQHYIFKTDRLSQNIGASIAVRNLTENVPKKYLESTGGSIVFAGGGNSVYEFDSEEKANRFISRVSEEALVKYPSVEMFLALHGYDEHDDKIAEAINELFSKLERKKSLRESCFMHHGLGIAKKCAMTQKPVYEYNYRDKEYLSKEAVVKNNLCEEESEESYKDLLPDQADGESFRFAKRFEELGGTKGEKDYIAVVAIDGNKMGKKIKKFREDFDKKNGDVVNENVNIDYKKQFKELSEGIEKIYRTAIRNMMTDLSKKLDIIYSEKIISDPGYDEKTKAKILPVRPLIMAGDDICFVADARLGLYLAEKALLNIEKQKLENYDFEFRSCAGVAFTKTSYPFFRSHELAEELCSNAKGIIPGDPDAETDFSVIDFHIVQGEIEGELTEIRREKYNNGRLTNKPYCLNEGNGRKNNLQFFKKRINELLSNEDMGRGVIKGYREALKKGEDESKEYLAEKRLKNLTDDIFENGHCIDFDVIEMLDIYRDIDKMCEEENA